MNPYAKGSQAYKKAAVNTQDQATLILMLYDGAVRFLKKALIKLEENDLEGAHTSLVKTKDIVAELLGSLNTEGTGEIGVNLQKLYTYIYNRLIDANIQKSPVLTDECLVLLTELREGWRAVIEQRKTKSNYVQMRGTVKPVNVEG
ncbi:MAG: flagellar export chaperone FliS [bacterium]|nr:flagellar export chaperone FliS [bacterium]